MSGEDRTGIPGEALPFVLPAGFRVLANQALDALMRQAGLTASELAALVGAEAASHGLPCGVDARRVEKWLDGRASTPRVAGLVAAVLAAQLRRPVTVGETGLVGRYPNRVRELRAAQTRPWTVDRLIVAMESAATELDIPLAARPSLKTNISRWENGHVQISPEYRRVLCRALSCHDHDLNPAVTDPGQTPASGVTQTAGSRPPTSPRQRKARPARPEP